jgi:hypothetical protein
MFKAIKEFFLGKPAPAPQPEAPYKVEAPSFKPTADAAPVDSSSESPVVKSEPKPRKPGANVAAKKIAAAKKPAAKKPAAPRKPKAPAA